MFSLSRQASGISAETGTGKGRTWIPPSWGTGAGDGGPGKSELGRNVAGTLTIGFAVFVGILAARQHILDFYFTGTDKLQIAITFVIAAFFPFSAIAYRVFQRDTQLASLQRDFELLGLASANSRSSSQHISDDVARRYTESYALWNFAIQSTLSVYFAVIGASLFFWPPATEGGSLLDVNTLQALRYGFLGAYIFSVQLIYRRFTTLDLQPTVYMSCTLTMLSGLAFNFVALKAVNGLQQHAETVNAATGAEAGILAIVAFSLGYFPFLAIGWFNRVAYTALGAQRRRSDALPLEYIDGISQLHEARLREEGIENIQNLAAAGIEGLLLNTRFSAQQVIEWVDQAILYLYLEPSEIDSFRRGGVRCISDFQDQWRDYYVEIQGSIAAIPTAMVEPRKSRAQQLQSTPERLDSLYCTTLLGPNMAFVENYWRHTRKYIAAAQQRASDDRLAALSANMYETAGQPGVTDEVVSALGQAAKALDAKHAAGPLDNRAASSDVVFGQAEVARVAGETELALQLYKRVLEIDDGYVRALNNLAWLYSESKSNLDEALAYAGKAVRCSKERNQAIAIPTCLDTLAAVQIRKAETVSDPVEREKLLTAAEANLNEADGYTLRRPRNIASVLRHRKEIAGLRRQISGIDPVQDAAVTKDAVKTEVPTDDKAEPDAVRQPNPGVDGEVQVSGEKSSSGS